MNVYIAQGSHKKGDKKYHTRFACIESMKFPYQYIPVEQAVALGYDRCCLKCQTVKSVKGQK